MKYRNLAITLGLTLLVILGGAFLLNSLGQTVFPANIKFDPKFIDMDSTYPPQWGCEIKAPTGSGWNVRDIDISTILFEHMVPIIPGSAFYDKGAQNVKFDGQAVWNTLLAKIGHLGVPPDASTNTPVHYYFTVSGYLTNGDPFQGQGWIAVRFPLGLPPPPPPPP